MAVFEPLAFGILALLNLGLALLVARARQPTLASKLLVLMFALNGAAALGRAVLVSEADAIARANLPLSALGVLAYDVNVLSLVPLAVLPIAFPWRRLRARGEAAVLALAVSLAAVAIAANVVDSWDPSRDGLPPAWAWLGNAAVASFSLLMIAGGSLGALLLLHAYLVERGAKERAQTQLFLAAYALRIGLFAGPAGFAPRVALGVDPSRSLTSALLTPIGFTNWLLITAAFLAIAGALTVRAVRDRKDGARVRQHAVILGFLALGASGLLLLSDPAGDSDRGAVDYLLVRPLLLSYGLLQVQLIDVDLRRQRALLLAVLLCAMGGVSLVMIALFQSAGAPLALSATLALVASVAIGTALALPLLRSMFGAPSDAPDPRRLVVYTAALESALHEGSPEDGREALRDLRGDLGLTDRDHALLVAQLRARDARAELHPGGLFLGRYRIARPLGRGGSGEVWLARDEREGREVAIKLLAGSQRRDAKAMARFRREMRLAGALRHPGIVAVHDVEELGDDAYLVMEHMSGGSLEDRLQRGPLPEREALAIARSVLAALGALHAKGIVHRDVKPSNILLDAQGRAKLSDFTIAQEQVSGDTVGATGPGAPAGTLAYMSPEQARGVSAKPASDVYSLGATLYAMLAGHPPIPVEGLGDFDARGRIVRDVPALPVQGASKRANEALAMALGKDPRERPSAQAMAAALP
ncbi:MAG TPA: serine/threonine-protein kinase [Candidatus Thermoplasmatota archaeon]|nr:serine/threonine-protein kinase [Candidatus Thermoplasmatota archaeon]